MLAETVAGTQNRRAVFLDRDGVLNKPLIRDRKGYAPRHRADFHLYPETAPALHLLKKAGLLLIVVTNQPDIGHGLVSQSEVDAMHHQLQQTTPLDLIQVCPHKQTDGCPCRKPRPGLLLEAAQTLSIDLTRSFMVGDRGSDIAAGQAVGCQTGFINRDYRETMPLQPTVRVDSVLDAAQWIVARLG